MKGFVYLAILGMLLTTSCAKNECGKDKDSFLDNYFTLIVKAKNSGMDVGATGWGSYDERFRAMVEECYQLYEAELSKGEKRKFWSKSVEYYYHRYKGGVLEVIDEKDDTLTRTIRKEVESRWRRTGEALDEALSGAGKNWEKARKKRND